MKIAIGGIEHETNTFADTSLGVTDLDGFTHVRGDHILAMATTRSAIGGMLNEAARQDIEVVPTYFAVATPSGTITADAYETMKAELLGSLASVMPLDAVALCLHGAAVSEGIEDVEADLVGAIRSVVGTETVIGATFDLHGNLTREMADSLDLMFGCHLYPHVDFYERGEELIGAIESAVTGSTSPVNHVERVPLLTPTSTTDEAPAALTNQRCAEMETIDGVLDCTFFHGFPHTDIGVAGASITVTTDNDPELAERTARLVAADLWARRDSFISEDLSAETALSLAARTAAEKGGPVVVNDTSDNPGGGSPGDATHLLRALLEADPERSCFGFIFDPAAAAAAHEAGVGATVSFHLGGHHDDLHGEPISVEGRVRCLTDGEFIYTSPMLAGIEARLGRCARIVVGNVDVVITSVRNQTFDDEVFRLHGIDVTRYDIVALKGSQHFRAGFTHLATGIVTADTPGLTSRRLEALGHAKLDGPRFPLDPDTKYLSR